MDADKLERRRVLLRCFGVAMGVVAAALLAAVVGAYEIGLHRAWVHLPIFESPVADQAWGQASLKVFLADFLLWMLPFLAIASVISVAALILEVSTARRRPFKVVYLFTLLLLVYLSTRYFVPLEKLLPSYSYLAVNAVRVGLQVCTVAVSAALTALAVASLIRWREMVSVRGKQS